ncbi:MBL fold metallo-hydrolase [Candidatus Parvarchaeota archaeon]|nr:MBL fold metallo-hydrolase [Candidatus Parvarchaeota archaeon]
MGNKPIGQRINPSLHELYLGRSKAFLIEASDGSLILVDTGMPKKEKEIISYINSIGKSVSDIKYILLTHAHIDHFGSAASIKKLSNANLAINENGVHYINGDGGLLLPVHKNLKSPKAKLQSSLIKIMSKFLRVQYVKPNMLLKEGVFPPEMKINAKILETPGHTKDSISVYLVDSNTVIVGDLLFGAPDKLRLPPFFDDYVSLLSSIKKIKDINPDLVCVSHGKNHNISDLGI